MDSETIVNFKWCIENDFQVYIKLTEFSGHCRVAIRKGGISTQGKSFLYCKKKDLTIYSTETLGSVLYKSQLEAFGKLPSVYKYLKETYDKI
jgi:hypothetical protein